MKYLWALLEKLPPREVALAALALGLCLTYRAYAGEGRKQQDVQIQQEANTAQIIGILDRMDKRVMRLEDKQMEIPANAAGACAEPHPKPTP